MTYYETWDEMDPRTNELTTATDAPPGVVIVRVEEYDRLRDQNADLLGQLDAVVFAHNVMQSERDRLREMVGTALQVIPRRYEDLSPVKKSRVIRDVMAVLGALQEAGDD